MHDAEMRGEEAGGAVAPRPVDRDHDLRKPAQPPEPRDLPREHAPLRGTACGAVVLHDPGFSGATSGQFYDQQQWTPNGHKP